MCDLMGVSTVFVLADFLKIPKEYAVVVANGEFPHHESLIELIKNAQVIICCDGAINNLVRYDIIPSYIIGDGDSITRANKKEFANIFIEQLSQNDNDLTKAVEFIASKYQGDNLFLVGATGLREDHTLANIGLLANYAKLFPNVMMLSDYGVFNVFAPPMQQLTTRVGQQISFFALDSDSYLSCAELKWPLNNFRLTSWYSQTLNEATQTNIMVYSSSVLLIFRAFEVKF